LHQNIIIKAYFRINDLKLSPNFKVESQFIDIVNKIKHNCTSRARPKASKQIKRKCIFIEILKLEISIQQPARLYDVIHYVNLRFRIDEKFVGRA
jgi:hypothetical protein